MVLKLEKEQDDIFISLQKVKYSIDKLLKMDIQAKFIQIDETCE